MGNPKFDTRAIDQAKKRNSAPVIPAVASFIGGPTVLEEGVFNSEKKLKSISVKLLRVHPMNIFAVENVPQLAGSIEEIGLIQNIEVFPNGDGSYTINAGHRRVKAYEFLANKYTKLYEETKDPKYADLIDQYSFIPAYILNFEEQKVAEDRFLDSNYQNRQNSFLTAIEHIEHLSKRLDTDSKSILLMAFRDGKFDPKDASNRIKVISKVLTDVLCISNASESTVGRYLSLMSKGTPELLDAVKSSKLSIKQAWEINTKFSKEQQADLLMALEDGRDSFDKTLQLMQKALKNKSVKKGFSLKSVVALNKSLSKMVSDEDDQKELNELFSKITDIAKRYI